MKFGVNVIRSKAGALSFHLTSYGMSWHPAPNKRSDVFLWGHSCLRPVAAESAEAGVLALVPGHT